MKHFRQAPPRPKKSSMVIGVDAVLAALADGTSLDKIYLDQKTSGEQISILRKKASDALVPINYVPAAKLNTFNAGANETCIAIRSKIRYQDLQEVISWVVEKGETPLFLILDGITDIRNIGGIARTALCTGVHALIIPDKGVGALNEDAILTSAGALETLAVCRVQSLLKAVDELHLNGIQVFASDMKATSGLAEMKMTEPLAIIMGSEEKGIYPALLKACDRQFRIPMMNGFESLNVSVATGMILYETMKQRSS